MRHFKKAILVSIAFIILVSVPSIICLRSCFQQSEDRIARDAFAGDLDYLIIGASQGMCAFKSALIDENLGCSSYNLCSNMLTFDGRAALLTEEIQRNNIKTVVIEISYNAFSRSSDSLEGDLYLVPRLLNDKERASYFFKHIDFFHWDLPFSNYVRIGASLFMRSVLKKQHQTPVTNSLKGFSPAQASDLTLSTDEIDELHDTEALDTSINQESVEALERMIDLIRSNGADVIFAVTPLSDAMIWRVENWSDFQSALESLRTKYHVDTYDFNLLKKRYELFHDKASFKDDYHLSKEGAEVFTLEYCRIMKMVETGQSVEDLFYRSYAEMKSDSPYNN